MRAGRRQHGDANGGEGLSFANPRAPYSGTPAPVFTPKSALFQHVLGWFGPHGGFPREVIEEEVFFWVLCQSAPGQGCACSWRGRREQGGARSRGASTSLGVQQGTMG